MAKLNVLVVDDDDVMRMHLVTLLMRAQHVGFELPSAIGVTRAIIQNRIDVVAIDVMMPTLHGDKIAVLLRQNPRLKQLGVVLISSSPFEELRRIAEAVEADGVVHKGDINTTFVAAVERAARDRRKVLE